MRPEDKRCRLKRNTLEPRNQTRAVVISHIPVALRLLMDVSQESISKRKWDNGRLRANASQPEDIVTCATVKVAKMYLNVLNKMVTDPVLYAAIKEVAPEWWVAETQITLNKYVTCKRHRDHGSEEHWILRLGDFAGGALNFDDGAKIEGKRESGTRSTGRFITGMILTNEGKYSILQCSTGVRGNKIQNDGIRSPCKT
jgi:hypothetical protein